MLVTKVAVTYGIVFNTGNYTSKRVEVLLEATVEPKENTSDVLDKLYAKAKGFVEGHE